MARARKTYVLVRRTLASGKIVWYYRLASELGLQWLMRKRADLLT